MRMIFVLVFENILAKIFSRVYFWVVEDWASMILYTEKNCSETNNFSYNSNNSQFSNDVVDNTMIFDVHMSPEVKRKFQV